ncbi:MarR family winged helix-turn-helix transcriptional regulator [Pseudolabrys taiwanensis]|nr:MarR family transcriptional regulator [Pseudolabrys taiwanensis]
MRKQKAVRGQNAMRAQEADSIEGLLAEWRRERPDLDPSPFGIFGRIWRLSTSVLSDAEAWLTPLGLTFESFSVIVTLRRCGPPYELNPTALYRESLLSSGAITNRIDRVEALGLVKRLPDPNDRRGTIVRLTAKGRTLADRAIKLHFDALAEMLSGIDGRERDQLAGLLSALLKAVEARRAEQPRTRRRR